MKKSLVIILVLALSIAILPASVWRVSNVTGASANFSSISAANSSSYVVAGDTLYIEASSVIYATATITKRLTIIGCGYFLSENPQTQANPTNSTINGLEFSISSQGSVVMGCQFNKTVYLTSNMKFQRNYINITTAGINALTIFSSSTDILVSQNYLVLSPSATSTYSSITIGNDTHNVIITGNYIENNTSNGNYAITHSGTSSSIIENNVIKGTLSLYNCQFNNNIIRSGIFVDLINTIPHNNICNDNQLGTTNGNQSHNMANVFLNTGSTDGRWKLATGSPAIGAGLGGVNCGMYAGLYPYKLSGIPPIPTIYEYFQIQNTNTQQLQIDFTVHSNN